MNDINTILFKIILFYQSYGIAWMNSDEYFIEDQYTHYTHQLKCLGMEVEITDRVLHITITPNEED